MNYLTLLSPENLSLLSALVGSAFTGLVSLIAYLIRQRKNITIDFAFKSIHAIYNHLNVILHETPASRVSIMKISNGGSIPRAGVTLYVTSLYEVVHAPLKPGRPTWQLRPMDKDLLNCLMILTTQKSLNVDIDNLEPTSELKDIFSTDSIKLCSFFQVYSEDGAYYYLMLEYLKNNIDLNPSQRELIRKSVYEIGRILKENSTKR